MGPPEGEERRGSLFLHGAGRGLYLNKEDEGVSYFLLNNCPKDMPIRAAAVANVTITYVTGHIVVRRKMESLEGVVREKVPY